MSVADEFRTFITRGNVIDMAVGFIIGAAFTAVVTALVADLFTPLLGIFGNVDFSAWQTPVGKSIFRQGAFLNSLISFLLIALIVFFAIVRPVGKMEARRKAKEAAAPPTTKNCPYCLTAVPLAATKCAGCTSALPAS